ncbi:hypothetical protein PENTCL1PPCAC_5026, partial [Pristionchus entomophagus]
DKVIRVESPLLDSASYYAPQESEFIYVLNYCHNILLVINTKTLAVSKLNYESPVESTIHSIAGIHNGILTMIFDGKEERYLATTK